MVRTWAGEGDVSQVLQPPSAAAGGKLVWVQTSSKAAFTAACEAGLSTFVFSPDSRDLMEEWRALARFEALNIDSEGRISGENNVQVCHQNFSNPST